MSEISERMDEAWRRHERRWKDHKYVYAVVSRRSRGVSIGINLNPDKACNFGCVYCQVNRSIPPATRRVDLGQVAEELDAILEAEKNGSLYKAAPFDVLKEGERGVRDIAFSGDGEPTTFRRLGEAVRIAAEARRRFGLEATRLVLITNGVYLDKPAVRPALDLLDENNGEIWAKLDAGSEERFQAVNRPNITLAKTLAAILAAARTRPLVIQSLWFRMNGALPSDEEIEAFCERLNEIIAGGGRIKGLQLYTIARDPAEPVASPLTRGELDRIASAVKSRVDVRVETY